MSIRRLSRASERARWPRAKSVDGAVAAPLIHKYVHATNGAAESRVGFVVLARRGGPGTRRGVAGRGGADAQAGPTPRCAPRRAPPYFFFAAGLRAAVRRAGFFAGPFARLSARSSAAFSGVIDSSVSPRGIVTLVTPSVR